MHGQKVEGAQMLQIYSFADISHFLTSFQYDNQVKFLMNGSLILCNRQSLNVEILQHTREKNLYSFGSERQKISAYSKFLRSLKDQQKLGTQNKMHISPALNEVFNFMKKYQEQLPGFKYILNEIINKQIFTAENTKITAAITLDFDGYLSCCERAQNHFFKDQIFQEPIMAQSESKKNMSLKKEKSAKVSNRQLDLRNLMDGSYQRDPGSERRHRESSMDEQQFQNLMSQQLYKSKGPQAIL